MSLRKWKLRIQRNVLQPPKLRKPKKSGPTGVRLFWSHLEVLSSSISTGENCRSNGGRKDQEGISPISLHRPEPNELCKPRATAQLDHVSYEIVQKEQIWTIRFLSQEVPETSYLPSLPISHASPTPRRHLDAVDKTHFPWNLSPEKPTLQVALPVNSPSLHFPISLFLVVTPVQIFCVGSCAGHVTWGNYTVPNPKRCPLLLYSSCQLIVLNLAVWRKWKSCREWSM